MRYLHRGQNFKGIHPCRTRPALLVEALEQRTLLSAAIALAGVFHSPAGAQAGLLASGAPRLSRPTEADVMAPTTVQAHTFPWYDGTVFKDKPNLVAQGLSPINVVYVARDTVVNEAWARATARQIATKGQIAVIDFERLSISTMHTDEATVRANMAQMIQIIDWMKNERPNIKLGYYDNLPVESYWVTLWQKPGDLARLNAANALLKPLADKVDYIFPSLYTVYDNTEAWRIYAEAQISRARQFGKPVIPFLWFEYHDNNADLKGQELPKAVWAQELATVRALADGAIIWGGWQRSWNDNANWWKTLQKAAVEGDAAPVAPRNVRAAVGNKSVTLTWTDAGSAGGCAIERSSDGVNFTIVGGVLAGATTYIDTTPLAARQYTYRVRARDPQGSSNPSAAVTVLVTRSAYAITGADTYDQGQGVAYAAFGALGGLDGGDWVKFSAVDFGAGGASKFLAELALPANSPNRSIQIRLDSLDSAPVATLSVSPTGGWSNYTWQSVGMVNARAGVHDVYLSFAGGAGVCQLRSIQFGAAH